MREPAPLLAAASQAISYMLGGLVIALALGVMTTSVSAAEITVWAWDVLGFAFAALLGGLVFIALLCWVKVRQLKARRAEYGTWLVAGIQAANGVATLALGPERREQASRAYALGAELFRKLVDVVLLTAPLGIGALTAVALGRYGDALFGPLGLFDLGVMGGHLVVFLLYWILLTTLTDWSPPRFLKETGTLWATTAATCSPRFTGRGRSSPNRRRNTACG